MRKIMTWLFAAGMLCGAAASGTDLMEALGGTARRGVDRGCEVKENPDGSLCVSKALSSPGSGSSRAAVSFQLKKPLDLNDKALSFELCPSAGFNSIIIAATNEGVKLPVLRGDADNSEMSAGQWTPVLLQFNGAEGMRYGFSGVSGDKPDRVSGLLFSIIRKAPHPAEPLFLMIRNVKIIPRKDLPVPSSARAAAPTPPPAVTIPAKNPFSSLGGLASIRGTRDETITIDPATGVLKITAETARNSKALSQRRISMRLARPLDLRGKSLTFDMKSEDLSDFCYLYLYNQGEPKAVWAYYTYADELEPEWNTVTLQRHFSTRLNWHRVWSSDGTPDKVDRIDVVYGQISPRMDGPISLELKNFRIGEEVRYIGNSLKEPVKLDPSSRLIVDGAPLPVVLHPDSEAGRTAAQTIVDAVKKTCGVTLQSRPGVRADGELATPAILLGNVWSNPAFTLIYGRRLVLFDGTFPGAGHFIVTTVKEPIRRGVDVLAVGASDDAGLLKGAETAAAMLSEHGKPGSLVTPLLFRADFGADQEQMVEKMSFEEGLKYAREVHQSGRHQSLAKVLAEIGDRYHASHDPSDARLFAAVAKMYSEFAAHPDPRRYSGPWGQDSDFSALGAISAADMIEHDPVLTDRERLDITLMLNKWAYEAVRNKAETQSLKVAHNHGTHGALGAVMAGLYFSKYYPEYPDGEILLRAGDRIFAVQNVAGKVHDDCNSYQWLTWEHVMRYAALRPDDTVLRNGVAHAMADMLITSMDNDRYQVPFGDTGLWTCYRGDATPIGIAACLTRDPAIEWAANEKYQRWRNETRLWGSVARGNFTRGGTPQLPVPEGFDGVHILPLAPAFYETEPPKNNMPPVSKCFDKLSFRQNFDRNSFYLLTDGVNGGGHGHADAMSIERLMLFGRQWLGDNHYYQGATRFHNSLTVVFDGFWEPYGPYAELIDYGADDRLGVVSMKLAGESFDWIRHLVWLRENNALAVLDEVLPHKNGQAILRQKWHCVGRPAADGSAVELSQEGAPRMKLEGNPGLTPLIAPDPDLGANWQEYSYAPGEVNSVEFSRAATLRKGEPQTLCTLWHGSADGPVPAAGLTELKNGGVTFTLQNQKITIHPTGSDRVTVMLDEQGFTPDNGTLKSVPAIVAAPVPPRSADAAATYPELPADGNFALPEARSMTVVNADNVRFAVGSASGEIVLLDAAATPVRRLTAPASVNALDAGDVNGDGKMEIIAGLEDETVRAYGLDGRELWCYKIPFYRYKAVVNAVCITDLNGDGKMEIIIANNNWRTIAIDGNGRELWYFETVREGRFIHCADLDGDGKGEALVGTKYYHVMMLSPEGLVKWKVATNTPGCLSAASITGSDRWRNLVLGTDGGEIMFFRNGAKVAEIQTGDQVPALAAGVVDGQPTIYCGSLNGMVYRYAPDGSKRFWICNLGSGVTTLAVQGNRLWAGTADGRVFVLSDAGKVLGCHQLSGPILRLVVSGDAVAGLTPAGMTVLR